MGRAEDLSCVDARAVVDIEMKPASVLTSQWSDRTGLSGLTMRSCVEDGDEAIVMAMAWSAEFFLDRARAADEDEFDRCPAGRLR